MRLLLDTHALLWWLFDDPKLPETPRGLLADPDNEVTVSSASAWEICTKHRIGKLPAAARLVEDIPGWLKRACFTELPITIRHAQKAGNWPQPHRDPFDRMLAAQSVLEDLPIVGRDDALAPFGVQLIW
ncbi:MAG: type II toxin-antitoxin system VapC family toxin [bacterium]|nr:type II toxin-antitoxin system VapC family toxin [bacterium]